MKNTRDLMMMSVLAFKNGQYEGSAKFFAEAMQSDDLNSFVDYISVTPDDSGLHGTTNESDNTLSPSIASQSSSETNLEEIVAAVERTFVSESSTLEDGEEEIEVQASLDEDDDDYEEIEDNIEIVSSVGPVKLK